MLKSIFAISLCFSLLATAKAVANPLDLFVEQCLNFSSTEFIPLPQQWQSEQLNSTTAAPLLASKNELVNLEDGLLALNNLNDRNNYYRQRIKVVESQQQLLNCQIHLADELKQLLASLPNNIDVALQSDKDDNDSQYRLFINILSNLASIRLTTNEKSQLHGLQASIAHNLRRQYQLNTSAECANSAVTNGTSINKSIAKYLLNQPRSECRKQAWQAYQLRAKAANQQALVLLHQLKLSIATKHGFDNIVDNDLHNSPLNIQQLHQFLHSQTNQLSMSPWDLPLQLKALPTVKFSPIESEKLFQKVQDQLSEFGLRFVKVPLQQASTLNLYQLWHHNRYLGELYFYPHTELKTGKKKITTNKIKQSVLGHQFGQYELTAPTIITKFSEYKNMLFAVSEMINQLIKSNKFYYLNSPNTATAPLPLGTYWLNEYLINALLSDYVISPRYQLSRQYKKQQNIVNSKLAVYFYQLDDAQIQQQPNELFNTLTEAAFSASFIGEHSYSSDMVYSSQAIANQGVNLYLHLWYQSLAQLLNTDPMLQGQNQMIFEQVLINEQQLDIYSLLSNLYHQPMDFDTLLWRLNHADNTPE
ncbi:hypothetical protein [Shewanella gaetbuli]|uniref:Uncharacterized protein n=1 Tax=Shewanella gaetbuli TaxID=220752 RepID=A0A9X2CLD0_9GAMM|nr:hypothetical protein [Shewanella gaetbuli]MCL1142609.1 hypothetical protein [Shewanella gaetbuli]